MEILTIAILRNYPSEVTHHLKYVGLMPRVQPWGVQRGVKLTNPTVVQLEQPWEEQLWGVQLWEVHL